MKNNSDKPFRGYVISHRAWYHNVVMGKEVMFGLYYPEGSTGGEMAVRWHDLKPNIVPRLECFDAAWKTLNSCGDVIEKLAFVNGMNIGVDEFVEILDKCGFKDLTPYGKT